MHRCLGRGCPAPSLARVPSGRRGLFGLPARLPGQRGLVLCEDDNRASHPVSSVVKKEGSLHSGTISQVRDFGGAFQRSRRERAATRHPGTCQRACIREACAAERKRPSCKLPSALPASPQGTHRPSSLPAGGVRVHQREKAAEEEELQEFRGHQREAVRGQCSAGC